MTEIFSDEFMKFFRKKKKWKRFRYLRRNELLSGGNVDIIVFILYYIVY